MLWQSLKVMFEWPLGFYFVFNGLYIAHVILALFEVSCYSIYSVYANRLSIMCQMKHVCIVFNVFKMMINNYCLPLFCFLLLCLLPDNAYHMALCPFFNFSNRWFQSLTDCIQGQNYIRDHPVALDCIDCMLLNIAPPELQ